MDLRLSMLWLSDNIIYDYFKIIDSVIVSLEGGEKINEVKLLTFRLSTYHTIIINERCDDMNEQRERISLRVISNIIIGESFHRQMESHLYVRHIYLLNYIWLVVCCFIHLKRHWISWRMLAYPLTIQNVKSSWIIQTM
ncbi:MAG: hypothetical protein Ta2E_01290 [Mycoplasmoidaceae bacterium]|nr:MAG: hypothetical protein Ta2E_01290 [Mycoplasmoidaceae bacterium]